MSFDELKNYAISDILAVNGKDKAARIIKNHMDNLIEVALIKGARSRQDEVDELNFKLAEMKSRLNDAYTDGQTSMYNTKQAEIDELQNRIDDVVKKLESIKTDDIRPHYYDYDKGWCDCAITVLSYLKGKENEH